MVYLRYIHLALLTLLLLPSLAAANVVITEVLADPPEGLAGDANRDGQYNPHEDEFIELYNTGSRRISLAGWRLGDAGSLSGYFRFPPGAVIEPGSYVVLFGGGNPSGFTIPVYTDDGTIGDGLTDTGESIHLINKHGDEVSFFSQSTWPDDQSLVRTSPDSSALVPHKTVSHTEAPFSPGYAPGTQHPLTYSLIISEVLADPPPGLAGDANRDGERDPYEDEFIELYNASTDTISLASWQLGDSASLNGYFRFPPGAFIAPHSYIVLFGGGNPSGFTIPVYTADGSICNGLTNSGEAIYLIDKTGYIVDRVSHDDWPEDQSIVRTPPNGGAFVPHRTVSPVEAAFSPGRATETPLELASEIPGIDTPPESASATPKMASTTSLQVWPNPFNTTAHLGFYLNQAASVHVAIYNVQGQLVRTFVDAPLHAGTHQVRWDGRDERGHAAATGPYFVRFLTEHSPPRYAKLLLLR